MEREKKGLTLAQREILQKVIAEAQGQKWALIPLLQRIQEEMGYIPPETIEPIAESLNLFPSQVQGVLSFYAQFFTAPRGQNIIRVCRGTACHVKGGKTILKMVKQNLGLEEGQTTPDYKFTLETVACLGTCFLAPVMMVNRHYFGKLVPAKVQSVLKQYA